MSTILEYLIEIGEAKDPDVERAERVRYMREFLKMYLSFRYLPATRTFNRSTADGYEMGIEVDHARTDLEHKIRINDMPGSVKKYFTPVEVYELTGVIVASPAGWGTALPKDFVSDIVKPINVDKNEKA